MPVTDQMTEEFEQNRSHLNAVAYRMLGSFPESENAVQEAWFRLERSDSESIDNLRAWLTTVVGRICLDMLRSRASRPEEPISGALPDAIVDLSGETDPEKEVMLADSVGMALMIVLETLQPPERLAFVLHDIFGVQFDQIATILEKSPAAARQVASRARRRVEAVDVAPDTDLAGQRQVIEAFLQASREGDFEALLNILDPDVLLRLDRGKVPAGASKMVEGAQAVVDMGFRMSGGGFLPQPALVNGTAGIVIARGEKAMSAISFSIRNGRITAINILADPGRLRAVEIPRDIV